MRHHDILVGKHRGAYLRLGGTEHVVTYARTRSGKTSALAIPNAFAWPGSLVALDVKSELFEATAGHRHEALGQEVYVLNPTARTGRTHRWNPLAAIDRDSPDRFDQIRRLSFSLWPDATALSAASSNSDRFWEPAGRSAWEGVATLIAETPELPLTMTTILQAFTGGDSLERLLKMIEARREAGRPYSRVAVDQTLDYAIGDQRQVDGIRKTVSTKLAPFYSPRLQAASETSDFDLRDLRRQPMSIYLCIPPGDMPRMRAYAGLFIDQLIALNSAEMPKDDPSLQCHTLLLLDEFLRLQRMVDLIEGSQYLAGYGIRMLFIVQDKAQLQAKYGPESTADLMTNVGAELSFGISDHSTTTELSERLGFNTVPVATESRPRWFGWFKIDRQTTAVHPNKRSLMLPQEIARLDPDKLICQRTGMQPVLVDRMYWKNDPNFTHLVRPPPQIPRITVKVAMDESKGPLPRPPNPETSLRRVIAKVMTQEHAR